jgi:hypothetical protein
MPMLLIATSITWDTFRPLSFANFRITSDSSLTVMLYWLGITLPPHPSQYLIGYNNNVIQVSKK